jgi:phage-related protein
MTDGVKKVDKLSNLSKELLASLTPCEKKALRVALGNDINNQSLEDALINFDEIRKGITEIEINSFHSVKND